MGQQLIDYDDSLPQLKIIFSQFKAMNPDALVQSWLEKISQTTLPTIEPNVAGSDTNDAICFQKDIPRTFPNELYEHEKTTLWEELIDYSQLYPQIGYRSGMSFIVAVINRLTHCDKDATKQIFKYLLYSQNVNLIQYLGNKENSIERIGKLFDVIVSQYYPEAFEIDNFGSWYCYDKILTLLAYRVELSQCNHLALIWDKIIKGNLYVLLQVLAIIIKKSKPEHFEALHYFDIQIISEQDLKQIEIKPETYYLNLILN